jgi:hypothetical protein
MADVTKVQTIFGGYKLIHLKLTNISDGTGELAVVKVDPASFSPQPTHFALQECSWNIEGFTGVRLYFSATVNQEICFLTGSGVKSWEQVGGFVDPKATGWNGQIKLTTQGNTANAIYDIDLVLKAYY